MARLFASAPPEVKMISSGNAFNNLAMFVLLISMAAFASLPNP